MWLSIVYVVFPIKLKKSGCLWASINKLQRMSFMSVVFAFNPSLIDDAPVSSILSSVCFFRNNCGIIHGHFLFLFVFTCHMEFCKCSVNLQCIAHWYCSSVTNSVVWKRKSKQWIFGECPLFVLLLCLRSKISSVSVVFVFNALPNAIAPSVSISQTVNKNEKNHWSGLLEMCC